MKLRLVTKNPLQSVLVDLKLFKIFCWALFSTAKSGCFGSSEAANEGVL